MCGSFIAINTESFFNENNYKKFIDLTNLISYRGPDNSGYNNLSCTRYNYLAKLD